jgi:hypothetical protein
VDESGGGDKAVLMGIARPAVRRLASSCAHLKPVSASHGKHRSLWTLASNRRSRLGAPPPAVKEENAEAHLAEDDWIEADFPLVDVGEIRINPARLRVGGIFAFFRSGAGESPRFAEYPIQLPPGVSGTKPFNRATSIAA